MCIVSVCEWVKLWYLFRWSCRWSSLCCTSPYVRSESSSSSFFLLSLWVWASESSKASRGLTLSQSAFGLSGCANTKTHAHKELFSLCFQKTFYPILYLQMLSKSLGWPTESHYAIIIYSFCAAEMLLSLSSSLTERLQTKGYLLLPPVCLEASRKTEHWFGLIWNQTLG